MWYGVSTIAAKSINYLLTPYLTYSSIVSVADYGIMGSVYSIVPLMNVLFTYGMETAYFRFIQRKEHAEDVNNTATVSLLCSTIFLSVLLWLNQGVLARAASLENFPLLIQLSILVIGLDALAAIPLARLRNEGRPKYFAFVRITSILVNVGITIFFLSFCQPYLNDHPDSFLRLIYRPGRNPISYVLIANVIQSAFSLLLLAKWIIPSRWSFNYKLWKEMLVFALPMLVVGIGGTINETFNRLMLGWWLPYSENYAHEQTGIFNACYKLAILISLFVQAFRMGAEPFFFKQAQGQDPQSVYARVMKFFIITICIMFLMVSLFLPVWKYFIDDAYWEGLAVVPILLLANMFLGIYYSLSVWYKVTSKVVAGVWITLAGTLITITINWLFIPRFSYMACAWATFSCYGTMMVISYLWGQKVYPVPYATKKLVAYMMIVVLLFFIHKGLSALLKNDLGSSIAGAILLGTYVLFILKIEKNEFRRLPLIGKYLK
ncbi:MAG: oligosaccharide flippase family protein [Chitinophagaceae bacterium]|nr:oligosaccharide flippase family protein [Chitinophagaceae bacterium]